MVKRHGNLWPKIIHFENLLLAARNAQRGKRMQASVLRFNFHRETELLALQRELTTKTYKPGGYTTFDIYDPKLRMISAAPYPIGWSTMPSATSFSPSSSAPLLTTPTPTGLATVPIELCGGSSTS